MTEFIRVTIKGTPVAKARPRFTRAGHAYNTAATSTYEHIVSSACQVAMLTHRKKMTGAPVKVEMALVFPIPASWSKRKQADAMIGSVPHTSKPDAENVAKAILDAMNGVVYADDKQVIDLRVTKHYGPDPRAVVAVTETMMPSVAVEIAA